jgi:quinol-cytochrome oxidoreductase complex cytochrome b subunit
VEILIELIFELLFDSAVEVVKEKRISKWIRVPLAIFILLFFIGVFAVIGIAGVLLLMSKEKYSLSGGIILLLLDVVLIVSFIVRMINGYKKIKGNNKEIDNK